MEMLSNFNIEKYLDINPPNDNSITTVNEIKELSKIPIKKKFVKQMDDIEGAFYKIVGKDPVVSNLIKESAPLILKIKKHHNRSRPKELAKKHNIKMDSYEIDSMKTPSYPSGHSVQGVLIANVLSDKYPNKESELKLLGRNISYSRRIARSHYKSDSILGERIGKDMYEHIKKGSR
jgi:hypothetical protein